MNNYEHLKDYHILKIHDRAHKNYEISVNLSQNNEETVLTYRCQSIIKLLNNQLLASDTKALRLDKLWEKTCFELFISKTDQAYREYNIALNGDWQCFDFLSYRSEPILPDAASPSISIKPDGLITIKIKEQITDLYNICFILKDENQQLNYFSIKKSPTELPDFHNKSYWHNIKG